MPFVLKAGKALNDKKAEIRIQLRPTPHYVFGGEPEAMRNEVGGRWGVPVRPGGCAQFACLCLHLGLRDEGDWPAPARWCVQLVVRLQPDEAIYLKMIVKEPGVWVRERICCPVAALWFAGQLHCRSAAPGALAFASTRRPTLQL